MKKLVSLLLALALLASAGALADTVEVDLSQPVTISIFSPIGNSMPYEEMPAIAEVIAKNNLVVEWEQVSTDCETRKNLILASGDLPDLFLGDLLTNSDVILNIESFVPLDDLIAAYAPNVQKMLDNEPALKAAMIAPDGNIYGLAAVHPLGATTNDTFFVNKDWLDALNLEVPTTTEEFRDMLRAFVTGDPNGNGIVDEIGYTGVNNRLNANFSIDFILGSFGIASDFTKDLMIVRDGEALFYPVLDDYREAIKYLASLWAEGLLDPELFTQDRPQMTAKFQGEVDIVGASNDWTVQNATGVAAEPRYLAIEPLEGPSGARYFPSNSVKCRSRTNVAVITVTNEAVERTMCFLNDLYDERTSLQTYFGSIPTCISDNGDGTYTVLEPPEGYTADNWQWLNGWNSMGAMYVSPEFESRVTPSKEQKSRHDTVVMYTPFYAPERFPSIFYTEEDGNALSFLRTDINNYCDDRFVSWIVNGNVDEEWDAYIDTLKAMGLDQLTEIYQRNFANLG